MDYLTKEAREQIASEIKRAGGNEVFFVGAVSSDGLIENIRVLARGNETSVPAILQAARYGEVIIHNHPGGDLTPSDPDIMMASLFGNRGVGFIIVNNDATSAYVVVEPFEERKIEPLDTECLKTILEPGGAVSRVLGKSYELRTEQLEMLYEVATAFNGDLILLIEAGTGTGKTMAYLIPSIYWAVKNGERVIVSTNTINLQEQLVAKDLPLLSECLSDIDFKYTLVKGMGNYLCLLRAETVTDGLFELFDDEEAGLLRDIAAWASATRDGTLSDLPFTPPEHVWDKVKAESESCLKVRCPYYSKCFFFQARREASSSDILIANHHIVFADLSLRGATDEITHGVLPPYTRIIFDEAHHLEEAATSHFGMRATKFGLLRILGHLKRKGRGGDTRGLIYYLSSLSARLAKYLRRGVVDSVVLHVQETLSPRVDEAALRVEEAFNEIYSFAASLSDPEGGGDEIRLRITDEVRSLEGWGSITEKFYSLRGTLKGLENELKNVAEFFESHDSEPDVAKILIEFKGIATKLGYYGEVIGTFFNPGADGFVRWVEGRLGRGETRVTGIGLSPLDVSSELKERLYSACKTVVMTSATLATPLSFTFIKSSLGLEGYSRVKELVLPSPFDYKRQALLAIPNDVPEPGTFGYESSLSSIILEAIKASGGGGLVLFTSYSLMQTVYEEIAHLLREAGIPTMKQGDMPRGRLLEAFKLELNSALFATDSFWEGIDIAGEGLRLVIITRLPFRVPTDPVLEARVEHLERQGINSFLAYTVPQAVLKFKQGFGRLIRTKTDRGAVLVLDRRIVSRPYGRYFIESLPSCARAIGSKEEILESLKSFFDCHSKPPFR